jgi:hypothetical protein
MEFKTTPITSNHSLYVPILPTDMVLQGEPLFDEVSMKFLFKKMNWGEVSRVDYVSKKTNNHTKISAFIHFEEIYNTGIDNINRLLDPDVKDIKIHGYIDILGDSDHIYHSIYSHNNPRLKRYFAVRINKNPIKEVKVPDLNIHQLIASNEFMEKLLAEQTERIATLEAELSKYKSTAHESAPMTNDEFKTDNTWSLTNDATEKKYKCCSVCDGYKIDGKYTICYGRLHG